MIYPTSSTQPGVHERSPFEGIVAFLAITTTLCYVVSHYCLGAGLAWLSQLLQQSLPALNSRPPRNITLPTDKDISMYALFLS